MANVSTVVSVRSYCRTWILDEAMDDECHLISCPAAKTKILLSHQPWCVTVAKDRLISMPTSDEDLCRKWFGGGGMPRRIVVVEAAMGRT